MRRILFLLVILFAGSTAAGAGDVYTVKDITIATPSTDSTKARNDAMFEAEKQAFDEVQKRLLAAGYISIKKSLAIGQISAAVDSIDIVSEKIGARDYRATYNMTFSKIDISRIFNISEVAPTEDPEKYLVVPIVIENGKMKIWKNEWLKNWQVKENDLILPLGDLQDVQGIKESDLLAKKYTGIKKIETRYGANNIIIVKAEYLKAKNILSVQLEKIKERERTSITYEYPGKPGVTTGDLFEAAANDVIFRLKNKKLTDASVEPDDEIASAPARALPAPKIPEPYSPNAPGTGYIGEKKAHYQPPITQPTTAIPDPTRASTAAYLPDTSRTDLTVIASDLIAWNRIRSKLTATPGISDLRIKSFVGGKANVSIAKNSDMEVLSSSLAAEGLELTGSEGSWQIKEKR